MKTKVLSKSEVLKEISILLNNNDHIEMSVEFGELRHSIHISWYENDYEDIE